MLLLGIYYIYAYINNNGAIWQQWVIKFWKKINKKKNTIYYCLEMLLNVFANISLYEKKTVVHSVFPFM